MLLNYFCKLAINKLVTPCKYNVEEYLYDDAVYPTYILVRDNFKHAMQHRLLSRGDILEFKRRLNKSLFKHNQYSKYKHKHYNNDCHEIYSKLQNKYLSKRQLVKLDKYITKIIKSKQCTIASSTNAKVSHP